MIRLEHVSRAYSGRDRPTLVALDGVDLHIAVGELVAITGRSGSGKTTLLNVAAGLAKPTTGRVLLDGVDVARLSEDDKARFRARAIGFVFQPPSLLPALTVVENLLFVQLLHRGTSPSTTEGRALALLSSIGLSERAHARPHELSAGEHQRAVIARALFGAPKILFADEPTSHLDEDSKQDVMALLMRVHREGNVTTMLVTHDVELLRRATQVVRMESGRVSIGAPTSRPR